MKNKILISRAAAGQTIFQVGALPFRIEDSGEIEFLVITTRETRRIVFPKGWPIVNLPDHKAAALEAWEEAGVEGRVATVACGSYRYWKRLKRGFVPVQVAMFPLCVLTEKRSWPEQDQRERRWVSSAQARLLVDEPGLVTVLDDFVNQFSSSRTNQVRAQRRPAMAPLLVNGM